MYILVQHCTLNIYSDMRGKSAPCTEGGIWAQFVDCQYCLAECCYHSGHLFFKGTSNFLHWQFIRHPKNPQFDSMGWTPRLLCGMLERKPDNAFPRRKGHLLNLQIKVHFQSFSAQGSILWCECFWQKNINFCP